MVSTTPALVPTHSSSSHTSKAVILRQAALCCLMMASEPGVGGQTRAEANPWPGKVSSMVRQKGSKGKGSARLRALPASILCTGGVTSTSASCSKVSGW